MAKVVNQHSHQIIKSQRLAWQRPVLSLAVDFGGAKFDVCPMAVEFMERDDNDAFMIPLEVDTSNYLITNQLNWGEDFEACMSTSDVEISSSAKSKYKTVLTDEFRAPGSSIVFNRYPQLLKNEAEDDDAEEGTDEESEVHWRCEPVDVERIGYFVKGMQGNVCGDGVPDATWADEMRYYYQSLVCVVAVGEKFQEEHRLYWPLFCVGCKQFWQVGNCWHCEVAAYMRGENDDLAAHAKDLPIAKNSRAAKRQKARWKYMDKTVTDKNKASAAAAGAATFARSLRTRAKATKSNQ